MDILKHLLHLIDMRVRSAVGSYQTVGAEVGVVDDAYKSHVSTESPDVAVILIFDSECLVYPVPDEAALQLVVLINQIPVILEVSYTVAHGMSIFAHNHRTLVALIDMAAQRPDACIHRAVYVTLGIITATLILYRAGGVYLLRVIV